MVDNAAIEGTPLAELPQREQTHSCREVCPMIVQPVEKYGRRECVTVRYNLGWVNGWAQSFWAYRIHVW